MSYSVRIKNSAKEDLRKLKQSNLRSNFQEVVDTLKRDPFEKSQSVERLVPPTSGLYSRRLNSQHRVVYSVDKDKREVIIY
ncbi:Txe/YoeB family addiction module toxin [Pediococcus argentinicus]|uniref:Endoribonuclease YoeB n=1 Tax=Pediococcus argentinicus TaxID=480391 RepID=A0A0R2NLH7_9LACO|nr:Txe/YoeB family addiction module toxin [Pediococcus argentinicus]KRO24893.1 hypothetical protein IV88_GL000557 [Pediococcus argentinicus]NKZ22591.1 Txe/YoeB family addiction module toxin [Pediococcus argentinicus]GEP19749.1 addiction module protein [Pediococcus argentinicus]